MTKPFFAITLIFSLLIMSGTAQAAEPSATYLKDWILSGLIPLQGPNPAAPDSLHLVGFDRNYLEAQGAEGDVRPVAGQPLVYPGGETTWKAWSTPDDAVDLDKAVSTTNGGLAYAYTEFEAAKAQAAVLAIGSNDGCSVWLNGEAIFDFPAARGLVLDANLLPVLLKEGTNRLLLKVEDKGNAWGFACRLLSLNENERWKQLTLFGTSQEPGGPATLNFMGPESLLDTLITGAKITIRRDDATGESLWAGDWNGRLTMDLPIDTTQFGRYVVSIDAMFAGGMNNTLVQPLSVGTPVDYTLLANGQSDYVIVVGDQASESERWAAEELQKALAELGQVTLPLVGLEAADGKPVISIGWNARTASLLGESASKPETMDESFRYQNVGGDIVIYGGSQRGTMYGVMAFLENELGVRYYTPRVTVIPERDVVTFRLLRFADGPGIRVRNDFYYEAFNPTWAARNRVNGAMNTREQPGGVEGYWSVHTFYPLLSPEEFFESHPEYFSLIDGKRTHDRAQLCLTHPDVLDIITDRLRLRMRENPGNLIYSLSQNDWHGACQCDNCQAIATAEESESGPVLWFVNQVAERIQNEFPDKFVGTLAYQYTRKPPKNIRPRENVVIRFCSIECCFAHDFTTCPQNVDFVKDMKGWAAIAPRIYVWDYVVSFSNYVMPFPNFSVLKPNIQTLRDHHAIGIMEQAAYQSRGGEFSELKAYLIAKLLWNPEAEVGPIIDDFMAGYYGRAGQYVRAYYDLVQDLVTPDTHFTIWIDPNDPLYNDDFVREGSRILDQAASVADDPEILDRVEMVRLPLLFLKCKRMPRQAMRDGSFDRLLKIVEREGVTHFAERGKPHWDEFVKEMESMRE